MFNVQLTIVFKCERFTAPSSYGRKYSRWKVSCRVQGSATIVAKRYMQQSNVGEANGNWHKSCEEKFNLILLRIFDKRWQLLSSYWICSLALTFWNIHIPFVSDGANDHQKESGADYLVVESLFALELLCSMCSNRLCLPGQWERFQCWCVQQSTFQRCPLLSCWFASFP